MTLILDLSEELEARLRTAARAEGTDEAEAVRHLLERALPPAQKPPREAKRPASGEEVEAMFAQWQVDAPEPTPEEDAAYDAMLRRLDGESGVTMRRVDMSDCE